MKIIGLTGGIGSGKSAVAGLLKELGAAVINMDELGHEALRPGGEARETVVKEFGTGIVTASGDIDRAELGRFVFGNPQALERLNRTMQPAMDSLLMARLDEYRQRGVKVAVVEAAALLEVGRAAWVDEVWVVTAPEAAVLKRLSGRPGLSRRAARARMRAQLSDEERIKRANVVIANDGTLDELKAKVADLWQKVKTESAI